MLTTIALFRSVIFSLMPQFLGHLSSSQQMAANPVPADLSALTEPSAWAGKGRPICCQPASSPKTLRREASHLAPRLRPSCNVLMTLRRFLRSAQSNGDEHQRVAQLRRFWRYGLGGTRSQPVRPECSPYKATPGPKLPSWLSRPARGNSQRNRSYTRKKDRVRCSLLQSANRYHSA
jgi:hypothetical protein